MPSRKNGGEWRIASSEWFLWRAVLLRCQKISAHQEWFGELNFCLTEKFLTEISAHQEMCPPGC